MAGRSSQRPHGVGCRWISWILVAVFTLQLYAVTRHSHAPSAYASDCVACAADGVPSLYAAVTPIMLLIWRRPSAYVLSLALLLAPCLRGSLLIPRAHGPPYAAAFAKSFAQDVDRRCAVFSWRRTRDLQRRRIPDRDSPC